MCCVNFAVSELGCLYAQQQRISLDLELSVSTQRVSNSQLLIDKSSLLRVVRFS